MLVHTFDYTTGAYTGPMRLGIGDLDPTEHDRWLIPGNATLIEPPRCGERLWPFWHSGQWHVCEIIEKDDPFEQFHCE